MKNITVALKSDILINYFYHIIFHVISKNSINNL